MHAHTDEKKNQLIYCSSFTTTVSTQKSIPYTHNILRRRGFPWDILFRKTKLLGPNEYAHMRARVILLFHIFWQLWIIFDNIMSE